MKSRFNPSILPQSGPLLREWKKLTDAETRAIRFQDWDELRRVHDKKEALQEKLAHSRDDDLDTPDETGQTPRQLAQELVGYEQSNGKLLAEQMQQTRSRISSENRSISTMNRVHQAYGAQAKPNYWQHYS